MFTLAHELGHTMHSYFTRRTQPYVYGDYTIFVAEVASTLNEALLTHYLLQHTDRPGACAWRSSTTTWTTIRGTLYRQTMFAEFEKITHEAAEAGEALTADRLSEMYYDLNKHYHGPDVVSDDADRHGVGAHPALLQQLLRLQVRHRHLARRQALAQQIISEGAPAVDRYLRFLSRGSSAYSIDLLRDAGVDMTTPEPVAQALGVFGALLDEMEQLLVQTGKLQPDAVGSRQ